MDNEILHTSYDEQQAFLQLSPDQQNLKIFLSSKETNGKIARAIRDIANIERRQADHDRRIVRLEHWQIAAAAIISAAIILGPVVFWALAQRWH
ncbi:MAG: hypothetical protein KGK07_15665 [Chloroflexota bacterium]|nr:hypothetical protein [Chloroflexota bacterium]